MAKRITWAIRVTLTDGRVVFLRQGGIGRGPILTFREKARADTEAAALRERWRDGRTVTVIERSHGRQ